MPNRVGARRRGDQERRYDHQPTAPDRSASAVHATASLRSPTKDGRARPSRARSWEAVAPLARSGTRSHPTGSPSVRLCVPASAHGRSPFGLPCTKYARRTFAIVSTISIPASAPMTMEASVDPQSGGPDWTPITPKTGSLFHADSQTTTGVTPPQLRNDAWEPFERAVDVVAKEPTKKATACLSWIELNRDALWPQTPQREGDPVPRLFREAR